MWAVRLAGSDSGFCVAGDVAQMVERSLSMREVRGSIPRISIYFFKLVQSDDHRDSVQYS